MRTCHSKSRDIDACGFFHLVLSLNFFRSVFFQSFKKEFIWFVLLTIVHLFFFFSLNDFSVKSFLFIKITFSVKLFFQQKNYYFSNICLKKSFLKKRKSYRFFLIFGNFVCSASWTNKIVQMILNLSFLLFFCSFLQKTVVFSLLWMI